MYANIFTSLIFKTLRFENVNYYNNNATIAAAPASPSYIPHRVTKPLSRITDKLSFLLFAVRN